MPSRSGLEPRPSCYVAGGGAWPDGALIGGAPPEAVLARLVSQRLRDTCEARGFNVGRITDETRLSQTAVRDLLTGETWWDLPTIARLEGRLKIKIWAHQQATGGYRKPALGLKGSAQNSG